MVSFIIDPLGVAPETFTMTTDPHLNTFDRITRDGVELEVRMKKDEITAGLYTRTYELMPVPAT